MRVLVTGATGFLGAAFVARAKKFADLDFYFASRQSPVSSSAEKWISPDAEAILKVAPDVIIHAAAMASAATCERDPASAWRSNVELTEMVALCAHQLKAHLVYVSTDLVFDGYTGRRQSGIAENLLPNPASVYARTKFGGELAANVLCSRTCIARISLLYGRVYGRSAGPTAWMIDAATKGEPITLFTDEWRTPLLVDDAVSALAQIARKSLTGIWHLGGPQQVSRVEFGTRVLEAHTFPAALIQERVRASVQSIPPRPEDVSLDSRKLYAQLNFEPADIVQGLRSSLVGLHGES